ncbi:MAG: imidazoleglycerol-phosphate dehydratase HisB [Clostridiales bacterium]|nr:imidazoleglycerol-phosphate dehydratase HisB [Clostridiales bacterium]
MRTYSEERKTAETEISLSLNLDGTGKYDIDSGCGFLDHMLTLFAKHSRFDLTVKCKGDTNVDYHHSVEDIGIVLGNALSAALGNSMGIKRYGHIILPMDEALILCAVDLGGRSYINYDLNIPTEKVGDFDTELTEEFMSSFSRCGKFNLHLQQLSGSNSHHIIEGAFKALGRAMREAAAIDECAKDEIPSTKGIL